MDATKLKAECEELGRQMRCGVYNATAFSIKVSDIASAYGCTTYGILQRIAACIAESAIKYHEQEKASVVLYDKEA